MTHSYIFWIYFIGVVACYFMGRAAHRACGSWTISERAMVILSCLGSWLFFVLYTYTWLVDTGKLKDISDKPAKW